MAAIHRTFLVECYLPGVTEAQVAEAGERARASAAALVDQGRPVTYLGAALIAADEVVFHAFHASELADVEVISRAAGLAFERIVQSVAVGSDAISAIRS